jgi:hypothetical protein
MINIGLTRRLFGRRVGSTKNTVRGTMTARYFFALRNIRSITPNHPHIRSSKANKQTKWRDRAGNRSTCVAGRALMFTADQYRAKAAESAESLKRTNIPSEIREFQRSKQSFTDLAQNEDWLADNFDKMIGPRDIHAQDEVAEKRLDGSAIAKIEEHILRCLGAAVIMQWNTIPTKLKRELFDTAGSLGEVPETIALRGRIARFLHDHKDETNSTDSFSKSNVITGIFDGA